MKCRALTIVMIFIAGVILTAIVPDDAAAYCVVYPPPDHGYRIYYHNSGLYPNCVQDFDLDMPEYKDFLTQFSAYIAGPATPLIGDAFTGCPGSDEIAHGEAVEMFYEFAYARLGHRIEHLEMTSYPKWWHMLNDIADNYGRGTVANLSNGSLGWGKDHYEIEAAIQACYVAEVLLVGAPYTFVEGSDSLGSKVLSCVPMNATGQFVNDYIFKTNYAAVGVPTNWHDDTIYQIAWPATSPSWDLSWPNEGTTGSLSTGLLSGCAQHVADALLPRGLPPGEFVPKVLDCLISGCDRNIDSHTYEHRLNEALPSFGPWSPTRGYGVFSGWKAILYAYGFGTLEAVDSRPELGGVQPKPTVFSDHFHLRGDLLVPTGQTFIVNPLATVGVDPSAPQPVGPPDLGIYPDLHEIFVAGNMEVATSLELVSNPELNGVSATVVVGSGGTCTVKDGGTITISSGQRLDVLAGGQLIVETGAEIVICDGGTLAVQGGFSNAGTLTLTSGSQTTFGSTSVVYLESDLNVVSGADLLAEAGCVVTIAPVDAAGAGSDPDRVEITCAGVIELAGNTNNAVVITGENPGIGEWVGITFNSPESGSSINYAQISDADIGLAVAGSAPLAQIVGLDVVRCGTGVKVTGRNTPSLIGNEYGGEISNCTNGVELNSASISLDGMSMHNNNVGLHATSSSPTVRDCDIYANSIGVATYDGYSIPDLGTIASPGNNDFAGPGQTNNTHILAVDPFEDIYAQMNWWGTTKQRAIQRKIWVIRYIGTGTVIFVPFLTGPPLGDGMQSASKGDSPIPLCSTPGMDRLGDNYPDPFNPTTTIEFSIASGSHVNLSIYNISGQLVKTLVNEYRSGNTYHEVWNGTDNRGRQVASGVYFYKLATANFRATKKLILLR